MNLIKKGMLLLGMPFVFLSSLCEAGELDGYWQSQKLHFYLEIKGGLFTRYQYTAIGCFRGGAGYLPAAGTIRGNVINNIYQIETLSNDEVLISRPQEAITTRLVRVSRIPSYCKGQPISTPLSNYYAFWHTINEIYHFSSFDKKQWLELYNQTIEDFIDLDMRLFDTQTEEDLFLLDRLRALMYRLKDAHIFLIAPSLNKTVFADEQINVFDDKFSKGVKQKIRLYKHMAKAHQIDLSWYANNHIAIGYQAHTQTLYIAIVSLASADPSGRYTPAGEAYLSTAIEALTEHLQQPSIKKLVIDLRVNDGGSIHYANRIASAIGQHINLEPATYIANETNDNHLTPLAFSAVMAHPRGIDTEVLVSKMTASAAEHLTLLLRNMGATVKGTQTRGAYSPVILKSLPNGWILGVPPYRTYNKNKQLLREGTGITPDQQITWKSDHIPEL